MASRAEGYLVEAREALAAGRLDDAYGAADKGLFNCPTGMLRPEQVTLVRAFLDIFAELLRREGRREDGLSEAREWFERTIAAGVKVDEQLLERAGDAYLEAEDL